MIVWKDWAWEEYCRAIKRKSHDPQLCVSIASSSPIGTWYCNGCHATYLSLRSYPPVCTGALFNKTTAPLFGSRVSNLIDLWKIYKYAGETGSTSALSYHKEWLLENE